ncbi:photosystem I reaction center subunit PsaK1 [Nostoc sp. HK-01]|uniref:Photosystem I reaction center subunit PsaK n=2 Tax=Nostocales TaxID=1161 RepID=A0A1Z4GI15_9CYAN|nr:photosystem I reaction center subunit PsaK [Nostoc cycadae]BAY17161.1 photosystem I reaction center subunit PsaK1 [Anabaenopsis circularis NIES-21]BBD58743.1 photosystem I reaction center subunit PsaK1 [Nostoc sp. HK-01]GBE91108.1 photosystem I reaction center subunit PsaK [Nostoc cycadae WK-1]
MLTSTLLAAATAPLQWSPSIGIIMILANVIAIAFGKSSIKYPNSEPALPSANFFGGFGVPALLATTAFGHILGVGIILGLHNLGRF